MICVQAPQPFQERLLREALAPLGTPIDVSGPEAGAQAPVLAVIWLDEENKTLPPVCDRARRSIVITGPGVRFDSPEADVFITRPFRPGVLTDHARTLLARAAVDSLPDHISIGIYDFYPRENAVHHKNTKQILRLTDKERDIILTLHKAGGKPVSRQDLLDSVWAYAPDVETHTLETHIYRLRQKIETDPAVPGIILTDEAGYKIQG